MPSVMFASLNSRQPNPLLRVQTAIVFWHAAALPKAKRPVGSFRKTGGGRIEWPDRLNRSRRLCVGDG